METEIGQKKGAYRLEDSNLLMKTHFYDTHVESIHMHSNKMIIVSKSMNN
jgi:hypothetical protein